MIINKKILAIIPARGGSKGIPRKNLVELGGKPLIVHTIEQAKRSKYINRLILSSDDEDIIKVAQEAGCEVPFIRPSDLATDKASTIDVVLHAIEALPEFDYVVILQTTSPFRSVNDIDECIEKCISGNVYSCVSVTVAEKSPYWMYTLDKDERMSSLMGDITFTRRQDIPKSYALNGAVYVLKSDDIKENVSLITSETIAHVMPVERSLDIDTKFDLKIARAMVEIRVNEL